MSSMIFYTNPMSRGRIARWMLEEVGAPYTAINLRYGPEMHTPAYLAINPMAKVPALQHGDQIVTECAAICAYLADAFPGAGLAPAPSARGAYHRWMFFGAGPWEAATTNRSLGVEVPADKSGMVGYGDFDRAQAALTGALNAGPYLCGDAFTAADVYVGSQIGWGVRFGSIPQTPVVLDYLQRVQSRPAAIRANELDDAAMAEFGPGG
jgi:glutathione S-transferase